MKIIGHRGAAGLALENTLPSLKKAKELKVNAVEFDVRLTKDRQLVLCHDATLAMVSDSRAAISQHTLAELQAIQLHNGEKVPTLTAALKALGSTPVMVEPKVSGIATELLAVFDKFPEARISVTTFQHDLARELKTLRPKLPVYWAHKFHPLKWFSIQVPPEANGVTLRPAVLTPLNYWRLRRRKLGIMVYAINSRLLFWLLKTVYPGVNICTDRPDKFLRSK